MAFRGTYVKFDACISTYSTCGLWHSKEDWGVNRCFFTSDWKSGPSSFQKKKRITALGTRILPTKTKAPLEGAVWASYLCTPSAVRARAPALAFQGYNTREKGLGEYLNEKDQRQAQKVTSWYSLFELVPSCSSWHSWFELVHGSTTIWYFWTTPWDLTYERYLDTLHPVTARITHGAYRRVRSEITAAWAE